MKGQAKNSFPQACQGAGDKLLSAGVSKGASLGIPESVEDEQTGGAWSIEVAV